MWYVIVLIICYQAVRSIVEGMNMTKYIDSGHSDEFQEGIRGHKYFRYYHRLRILETAFWGLLCVLIGSQRVNFLTEQNIYLLIGGIIVSWQIFENCYSFARYQYFIPESENLLGAGTQLDRGGVMITHTIRWILGVGFLIIGVLV